MFVTLTGKTRQVAKRAITYYPENIKEWDKKSKKFERKEKLKRKHESDGWKMDTDYNNIEDKQKFWNSLTEKDKKKYFNRGLYYGLTFSGKEYNRRIGRKTIIRISPENECNVGDTLTGDIKFTPMVAYLTAKGYRYYHGKIPNNARVTVFGNDSWWKTFWTNKVTITKKIIGERDQVKEFLDGMKQLHDRNE